MQISESANTVIERRYLQRDPDGKILETPEDMFKRVADAVSNGNEKKAKIYYDMMTSFDFLPNSPTLMNAGTELGMLSACVSGNSPVYTKDGLKEMKEVQVGDYVLTHKGRFRKVLAKKSSGIKQTILITRGTKKRKEYDLRITKDHLCFTSSGNWEEIGTIGPYESAIPKIMHVNEKFPNSFDMLYFGSHKKEKQPTLHCGKVYYANYDKHKKYKYGKIDNQSNPCNHIIINDEELAWLFGCYISNGSVNSPGGYVRFTFNSKKHKKEIERILTILNQTLEFDAKQEKSSRGNWITVKLHNTFLATLLSRTFGKGFANKKLPEWMWNAPPSYRGELINGIMMDALVTNEIHNIKIGHLTLANPTLVYQILLLARSLDLNANFKYHAEEKLSKSKTSKTTISSQQYIHKIVKKDSTPIEVFDIEVEEDHSFVAGDFCLHNCFVIPIPDSIVGIMDAAKIQALVQKSGGGTGFSFSRLRPSGDLVRKTSGISSGPLSFLEVFNATTEAIKQGGKRRGANIAILQVDHVDILDFIHCKTAGNKLNNFNISVAITDEFMLAVANDNDYNLINPRSQEVVMTLNARDVLTQIADEAWKTGDPGVIFIDVINKHHPVSYLGKIESTNPCGETGLLPFESCNLGSINLANFIETDLDIDWDRLKTIVEHSVDFLDGVIEINVHPTDAIKKASLKTRKIGLGIMGFADMLTMMRIPYDSDETVALAEKIMLFIQKTATDKSIRIAKELGSFPAYDETECNFEPRRNATLTTIAPTGSISMIADCSSGIEPYYALAYKRKNVLDGAEFTIFCSHLEKDLKEAGLWQEETIDKIIETGSIQKIKNLPKEMKDIYKTSHEIPWQRHVAIQAAAQAGTCNAVSKTVNLPTKATKKDIYSIYIESWESGCKGVTIYRDNSREEQVLVKGPERQLPEPKVESEPQKRPVRLSGLTEKIETSCGTLYVTINWNEKGKPFEVFARIGKAGGCASSQSEMMGRLISMSLRSGIEPEYIVKQLRGITCHLPKGIGKKKVASCADAAAQVLENIFVSEQITRGFTRGACPDCQGPIEHEGGCLICRQCGFSECL